MTQIRAPGHVMTARLSVRKERPARRRYRPLWDWISARRWAESLAQLQEPLTSTCSPDTPPP